MELYFYSANANNKALNRHFLLSAKVILQSYRRMIIRSALLTVTNLNAQGNHCLSTVYFCIRMHKESTCAPDWLVVDPVVSLQHSAGYLGAERSSWSSGNWLSCINCNMRHCWMDNPLTLLVSGTLLSVCVCWFLHVNVFTCLAFFSLW